MASELFKYLRDADHAQAMVEAGVVRIGTLAEYRAVERAAVGEPEEPAGPITDWGDAEEPAATGDWRTTVAEPPPTTPTSTAPRRRHRASWRRCWAPSLACGSSSPPASGAPSRRGCRSRA